jgi:hypothetical protein
MVLVDSSIDRDDSLSSQRTVDTIVQSRFTGRFWSSAPMSCRLNPHEASPKSMQELISFQEFPSMSGLDPRLLELVRTHVSQLNWSCPVSVDT